MINLNLLLSIIILIGVIIIYKKLENNENINKNEIDYDLVKKYLFNEKYLENNNKPILWIPIEIDKNSRKWESFYSRNNYNLNQDYLYLTITSIINKCGNDFTICIIDDISIEKLLPSININLQSIGNPVKKNIYNLLLMKVLYNYGGIMIPPSFICFNSFIEYYNNLSDNNLLINENINTRINSNIIKLDNKIIACKKNSNAMNEYIKDLEYKNSMNYSDSFQFDDLTTEWLNKSVNKNVINIIDAKNIGILDNNNQIINIDTLLSNNYIPIDLNILGIYLPYTELLNRISYKWFIYLNKYDVLNSDTQIGKYLLYSLNNL